jgi:hypothetical protein
VLLVVFGAGASYDADPQQPAHDKWRPPLTDELVSPRASFGEALNFYPSAVALVAQLRNSPDGTSLEERLDQFQTAAKKYKPGLVHLAAFRFYVRYITWRCARELVSRTSHVTNYVALLAMVDAWANVTREKVVLATFNYDGLLDDACAYALRLRLRTMNDYVSASKTYQVLKLHGSWNWTRRIANPIKDRHVSATMLINQIADLEVTDQFEMFNQRPGLPERKQALDEYLSVREETSSSKSEPKYVHLFPALALPLRSKAQFDCPSEQVVALRDALPQVSALVTVGWRAQEQHFLAELTKGLSRPLEVHVVSGTSTGGQRVRDRLSEAGVRGNFSFFPGGFTDYVRSNALASLLGSSTQPRRRAKG